MLNDKQKLFIYGLALALSSLLTKAFLPGAVGLPWILIVLAIYLIITSFFWRDSE
jgi:hypothetical protein